MPLKILIVDDHEVAREGLANLLTTPHIEVSGVLASGEEALANGYKHERFDAVLLDVQNAPKGWTRNAGRDTSRAIPSFQS